MGEGTEVRDDSFYARKAFLDVFENVGVLILLFRRDEVCLALEGIKAGGGEVERVIDLMDDARAHAAERRQLLGLDELGFSLLKLLDGFLEDDILLRELALKMVGVDEVLDSNVEFG